MISRLWIIEDTFRDVTGACLVSASGVSALTDRLWEDYEAFTQRDLSGFAVEYLFLDAIYESLPLQGGGAEGLLCAWGILADGRKILLHLTLGNKENYGCWLGMLRDMVRRGLPVAHRKYPRTTNLIERSFLEERRRTKIVSVSSMNGAV